MWSRVSRAERRCGILMPQGGIGFHYFTREKRSIDVGLNAVHISSASLGDKNPGVNASLQLQIGYTFWK